MKPADNIELIRLILASIDGTITPEEFAVLDRGICENPEIADQYAEFMLLYTGLRQPGEGSACFSKMTLSSESTCNFDMRLWNELDQYEKTAEAVEIHVPGAIEEEVLPRGEAPRIERKISRLAIYTSIFSAAALVLLLLYVQFNPLVSAPIIGMLTETVDVKWHHSSIAPQRGQDVRAGKMELQWGLAEIRFDSGADVIVEGPAQVEFLTSNSMLVQEGKVYAKVEKKAAGFTVRTPGGTVKDIGTEFGVYVNPTGVSEVQVFQGEVHLYPDDASHFVKMFSGDAKSFAASGPLRDIPFRPMAFVRHEEMDAKVQSGQSGYHRWKATVLNLHRDPALAAHYFYDQDETNPQILTNAAPLASRKTDGRFGADGRDVPEWVQGRWPQKQAVCFDRNKDHVILIGPDRSLSLNGPLTISTWVYYPNDTQKGGHLISCRENNHVNYQFSIFDDQYVYPGQYNRFEFLRFSDNNIGSYSRPYSLPARQWEHYAVVYDGHTVSFYVNGTLFEKRTYEASISSRDAEIILGAMKIEGRYVLAKGDFDGIVDELMIFSRCLNEAEIQMIYETGKPDSAGPVL
jgi:hypothetical protein